VTEEDRAYMRRALDLARNALGQTAPNPAVGCVVVKGGQVVGEGYHPRAGMPHAEVYALRAAGRRAAGATAYVTLEPCDHYGRTPPCSRALVAAGVARCVVGAGDPNPLVDGGGVATLRAAGIEVEVGCEEEACYQLNLEFMERMRAQAAGGGGGTS
jgi:diaminohydroxyphosphoribosylaminopyrimidine deaminase/5-amino-6-(5-phosphoribosylamino)uracil reductase